MTKTIVIKINGCIDCPYFEDIMACKEMSISNCIVCYHREPTPVCNQRVIGGYCNKIGKIREYYIDDYPWGWRQLRDAMFKGCPL